MGHSALRAAVWPFDQIFAGFETGRLRRAKPPERPIVLVCGPPRSGTTLLVQVLVASLRVAYMNNLTAIFPCSPLFTSYLHPRPLRNDSVAFRSFYGKTRGLSGLNDGLHLWDRWLGPDRTRIPEPLDEPRARALRRFFGALEARFDRPVVNKNNNLNVCARHVADVLPTATFICLRRDPLFLAQSLLLARRMIHGDDRVSYGVDDPARPPCDDPIADVCRQVRFYSRVEQQQFDLIGPERFWRISYEEFCREPGAIVAKVAERATEGVFDADMVQRAVRGAGVSRRRVLQADEFARLEKEVAAQGLDRAG